VAATLGAGGGGLTSGADGTRYSFPAGALAGSTTLTHTPRFAGNQPSGAPLVHIGHAFELASEGAGLAGPALAAQPYTIRVTYSEAERGPAIESTLALYVWDGLKWAKLPGGSLNPVTNTVTATSDRLGTFAVLGETKRAYLTMIRR
jgi:hypothetical protein